MPHLMLDIETLDTKMSSVILSIGCVEFDSVRCLGSFYQVCDPKEQVGRGRTMSIDTVEFWLKNAKEYPWEYPTSPGLGRTYLYDALVRLHNFIDGISTAQDTEPVIWALPPSFDCGIIEHANEQYGVRTPWTYKRLRDVRTARESLPPGHLTIATNPHNALSDCYAQIDIVRTFWAMIHTGSKDF